ncbi:hypothetical protein [Acidisoma silvae]|uniref:Uncharacterized protein n=1 Tax=Acidisoma silvae TaxID=2802396 RepID=A0A963YVT7_9PROT|nr:hypothetical protein [Acidisoma silvae]MCB8877415.1 hypothetical protein [Acidisoma silvae]
MRLHHALQLIQVGHFDGLKHWSAEEVTAISEDVMREAADAAEFRIISETDAGDSLGTFQRFGFDLWSSGLAQAPYSRFWLSWSELTQGPSHPPTSLAAMCHHIPAATEIGRAGIGLYVMAFLPRSKSGFQEDRVIFTSRLTAMWLGDTTIRVSRHDSSLAGIESVRSAYRAVAALIGALGTPLAWRRAEPAPEKLNRQRLLKGRPEIRSQILIDLRPSHNRPRSEDQPHGGWSVKPHWRRGHIRALSDGRRVPIPPCCVNMEEGIPVKPEYVLKTA